MFPYPFGEAIPTLSANPSRTPTAVATITLIRNSRWMKPVRSGRGSRSPS